MRTVEITRSGDASVADQLAEMRDWLKQAGIEPLALEAVRILQARVRYRATFASETEAERFCLRFDEDAARTPS